MSRVSPATNAAAMVEITRPGSPCSICGSRVTSGGFWMTADGPNLHVCGRDCAQKFLLLALDTLADTEGLSTDAGGHIEALRFMDETFDRWTIAEERRQRRDAA